MDKYCTKCNLIKNYCEFSKNKNTKDGYNFRCKECEKRRISEYHKNNPEKQKKWVQNNPDKIKQYQKNYIKKNPDKHISIRIKIYRDNQEYRENEKKQRKKYYQKNIESLRLKRKEYYLKNKKIEREKNNEWKRNKRLKDPLFRIKKNIRDRIKKLMINDQQITKRTFEIIGLTKDDFKKYIENQFKNGMCWENYGDWHIDHITPLNTAKNVDELFKLNHYSNLRPLWGDENIKRNRKYD